MPITNNYTLREHLEHARLGRGGHEAECQVCNGEEPVEEVCERCGIRHGNSAIEKENCDARQPDIGGGHR